MGVDDRGPKLSESGAPRPDRSGTPDGQNPDHRTESRIRRLTVDARRLEQRLVSADRQVATLRQDLRAERERSARLRRRLVVRIADRLLRSWHRVPTALGPRDGAGHAPRTGADAPPAGQAPDGRELAGAYRERILQALTAQPGGRGLTVEVVGQGASASSTAAVLIAARHDVRWAAVDDDGFRPAADAPHGDADVVIAFDPSIDPIALGLAPIRVAITDSDPGGALRGDWDLAVLEGPALPGRILQSLEAWIRSPRATIRIPTASAEVAERWGDTFLGRDLRDAIRRAGWPARIVYHDRWDDPAVGRDDVVIDLLGLRDDARPAGTVRLLWQISHPELASTDLYERYDTVFVASDGFCREMAAVVKVPVLPLHQAADVTRFHPGAIGPRHRLLYVANWRPDRAVIQDLVPTERGLAVFGRGWTPERLDPAYVGGEAIANEDLAGYYAGADIVLNDHWAGMRREGFLSNRLYDAAAVGALVISDDVVGLDEEFDGGVLHYRDREHLQALIGELLGDPDRRHRLAERARAAVVGRHSMDRRAREIIATASAMLAKRA